MIVGGGSPAAAGKSFVAGSISDEVMKPFENLTPVRRATYVKESAARIKEPGSPVGVSRFDRQYLTENGSPVAVPDRLGTPIRRTTFVKSLSKPSENLRGDDKQVDASRRINAAVTSAVNDGDLLKDVMHSPQILEQKLMELTGSEGPRREDGRVHVEGVSSGGSPTESEYYTAAMTTPFDESLNDNIVINFITTAQETVEIDETSTAVASVEETVVISSVPAGEGQSGASITSGKECSVGCKERGPKKKKRVSTVHEVDEPLGTMELVSVEESEVFVTKDVTTTVYVENVIEEEYATTTVANMTYSVPASTVDSEKRTIPDEKATGKTAHVIHRVSKRGKPSGSFVPEVSLKATGGEVKTCQKSVPTCNQTFNVPTCNQTFNVSTCGAPDNIRTIPHISNEVEDFVGMQDEAELDMYFSNADQQLSLSAAKRLSSTPASLMIGPLATLNQLFVRAPSPISLQLDQLDDGFRRPLPVAKPHNETYCLPPEMMDDSTGRPGHRRALNRPLFVGGQRSMVEDITPLDNNAVDDVSQTSNSRSSTLPADGSRALSRPSLLSSSQLSASLSNVSHTSSAFQPVGGSLTHMISPGQKRQSLIAKFGSSSNAGAENSVRRRSERPVATATRPVDSSVSSRSQSSSSRTRLQQQGTRGSKPAMAARSHSAFSPRSATIDDSVAETSLLSSKNKSVSQSEVSLSTSTMSRTSSTATGASIKNR